MTSLPAPGAGQAPDDAPAVAPGVLDAPAIRAAYDSVDDLTVGLEEEVVLVDLDALELAPRAREVLEELSRATGRDGDSPSPFKLELPAAQIELLTPPVASVAKAADVLHAARRRLVEATGGAASPVGCGVSPVGSIEGELNPGERYEEILAGYRVVARRQLVCALQVHVAVRGAERALSVYNALREWLPAIAALAANAPFQDGADTGMASVRPSICTMLPRQGVPPALESWDAFAEDLAWGAAAGGVPELRRWWWELRPHAAYGTLELRVPDTQINCADSAAVAAFVHCLVASLAWRCDAGELAGGGDPAPAWRIGENRWAACRDGVDATFADLRTGARRPVRELLLEAVEDLAAAGRRLGCEAELAAVRRLCETNGARRQWAVAGERGVAGLARWLADEFAAG